MWEDPAEKLHAVAGGGAGARTSRLTLGKGAGAGMERDKATGGDGDLEDIGGKGCEGRVAMWMGLAVDIPGEGPDLWVDVLQQASWSPVFFEEGAGDG